MTSYQWLNELISYLFLILDSHVWQLIISVIILHLCSSTMQYLNIHNHVKKNFFFFYNDLQGNQKQPCKHLYYAPNRYTPFGKVLSLNNFNHWWPYIAERQGGGNK